VKLELEMRYVAVEEKKAGGQVTGLSEFPGVLPVIPSYCQPPLLFLLLIFINYPFIIFN
jgi:hypothetical protein